MFKKGLIKGENKNHLQTIKKFRLIENLKVTMNFLSEVPLPQVVIQLSPIPPCEDGRDPTYETSP